MPDREVNPFDESYFMDGVKTGKSLYENYRWLPDLTLPMVKAMIAHLGIARDDKILDFGCSRGYTVKAFNMLEYDAYGMDCSKWAITNCDQEIKGRLAHGTVVRQKYSWIIAKDVLEHIVELRETIANFKAKATKGIFVVVPLGNCGIYAVPEYDLDVTHVWRLPLAQWAQEFMSPGWAVTAQYRLPGVKDNYKQFEEGNGFLTIKRLS